MTEQEKSKKTRRRFLADMLFLGGGISAAGLLAQSQIFDRGDAQPHAVGEMVMPEDVKATPCDLPPDSKVDPPMPGASVPPMVDGDYAVPSPPESPGTLPPTGPTAPVTGGKPVAPKQPGETP